LNAKTEDLWTVLEEESGEPVKTLMDSWTKQKGYPVVYVTVKEGKLELEQVCLNCLPLFIFLYFEMSFLCRFSLY